MPRTLIVTTTRGLERVYEAEKVQESTDHTELYLLDESSNVIGILPKATIERVEPGPEPQLITMGMSPRPSLQDDVAQWHREKYPDATLSDIGLKLAEEAGEACRAIDRIKYAPNPSAQTAWTANLTEEIGQTGMVLVVLASRLGLPFERLLEEACREVMER